MWAKLTSRVSQQTILRGIGGAMAMYALLAFVRVTERWQHDPGYTQICIAFGTAFAAYLVLSYAMGMNGVNDAGLRAFRLQKELAEAREQLAALGSPGDKEIQQLAIEAYQANLRVEADSLRRRAYWSFVPGVALCVSAMLGPVVAYQLASRHPATWQYMLGGSALAIVLLGAGTALLRHDAKLNELAQVAQKELQYFSRLLTGLDCARALGPDDYKQALTEITRRLISSSAPNDAPASSDKSASKDKESGQSSEKNGGSLDDVLIEAAKLVAREKSQS